MKPNYDIASEMLRISESEAHQKLFQPMVKEAFSREGKEEPSEVEAELNKLNKTASCECGSKYKDCSCDCHKKETKKETEKDSSKADDQNYHFDTSEDASHSVQASFPLNAVQNLMKISEQLEAQGLEKVAAASLVLAEAIVKEAKKKAEKSKSKSKSESKSKDKMTTKERMEAMRKAKEKGKDKSKSKSDSKSKSVSKSSK